MAFLPTTELKPHPKNIEIYGDEDVGGLVAKIRESNWIKPLTVTQNNTIISGHRRYQACKQLGISSVPVEIRRFNNEYEELEALLLENEFREKTKEQKVKEGRTWEVIEGEKAKQRMLEAAKKTNEDLLKRDDKRVKDNCPEPLNSITNIKELNGQTRDAVAKKVGFGSGRDYERAKKVVEAIEEIRRNGDFEKAEVLKTVLEKSTDGALKLVKENNIERFTPERIERIKTGEASINEIHKEIKIEERVEERRQEVLAPPPLPLEEYNVILADPPWRYDFSATENRQVENQYPTMEVEDICRIKVPAADDAVLFLWATAPKLREALQVVKAWGFEYKTNMVWIKDKIGMGYYARGQHELLLIATKGSPKVPLPESRPPSVITAPRTKHSEKPDVIYSVIESMYPANKYLELFARNERNGWGVWGNQV